MSDEQKMDLTAADLEPSENVPPIPPADMTVVSSDEARPVKFLRRYRPGAKPESGTILFDAAYHFESATFYFDEMTRADFAAYKTAAKTLGEEAMAIAKDGKELQDKFNDLNTQAQARQAEEPDADISDLEEQGKALEPQAQQIEERQEALPEVQYNIYLSALLGTEKQYLLGVQVDGEKRAYAYTPEEIQEMPASLVKDLAMILVQQVSSVGKGRGDFLGVR